MATVLIIGASRGIGLEFARQSNQLMHTRTRSKLLPV
jgi:short-subunit dehydrogenase